MCAPQPGLAASASDVGRNGWRRGKEPDLMQLQPPPRSLQEPVQEFLGGGTGLSAFPGRRGEPELGCAELPPGELRSQIPHRPKRCSEAGG